MPESACLGAPTRRSRPVVESLVWEDCALGDGRSLLAACDIVAFWPKAPRASCSSERTVAAILEASFVCVIGATPVFWTSVRGLLVVPIFVLFGRGIFLVGQLALIA